MTPLRTSPTSKPRGLKLAATVIAAIVAILLVNTMRSDTQDSATVSTQSVFTLPGGEPTAPPTAVPTTAPLALPTPTATAVPTATPAPTATATPEPTATAQPTPTTPPVSVANAQGTAQVEPAAPAPAATAVPPPATAIPEPTATPVTPEPTPVTPDATPEPPVVDDPTPEPTPEPTPTPIPVQTAADLEIFVLGEINKVRAQAGMGPVAVDPAAVEIARDWSRQMATGGFFQHRPPDQLNQMLPSNWQRWGENIASAPDIFWAQSSLEASAGHYENMVGPFTHVGVGVYTTGSQVWLTQVFVRY